MHIWSSVFFNQRNVVAVWYSRTTCVFLQVLFPHSARPHFMPIMRRLPTHLVVHPQSEASHRYSSTPMNRTHRNESTGIISYLQKPSHSSNKNRQHRIWSIIIIVGCCERAETTQNENPYFIASCVCLQETVHIPVFAISKLWRANEWLTVKRCAAER